jgi:hypothetical protein
MPRGQLISYSLVIIIYCLWFEHTRVVHAVNSVAISYSGLSMCYSMTLPRSSNNLPGAIFTTLCHRLVIRCIVTYDMS